MTDRTDGSAVNRDLLPDAVACSTCSRTGRRFFSGWAACAKRRPSANFSGTLGPSRIHPGSHLSIETVGALGQETTSCYVDRIDGFAHGAASRGSWYNIGRS